MSQIFSALEAGGHEQVVFSSDPSCGYRGIIAIHSTALGPAVGGTRWWRYQREEDALFDVLRLSRGMSYKNALAGLALGGGKGVILAPTSAAAADRRAILRAHGRFIERFQGLFRTGEDVGTSPADMEVIAETTRWVGGRTSGTGDPSPYTGRGVFRAMQAAAQQRWGSDALDGRTVALQGCGNVGYQLARQLSRAGARLVVSDLDPARAERVVREFGATEAPADRIHAVEADGFAPCALGGVLNDQTVPALRVALVVGGANNQLLEPRHGDELHRRGILYVPDYVANAGGVSYGGAVELLGVDPERARARVEAIYDTTVEVLRRAAAEGVPPSRVADRMAEERIRAAKEGGP